MKGLFLKDMYMIRSYCRAYLLISVVFIAVSVFSETNAFFVIYPCLLCSLIPVTLISYDEKSHWMQYSATLPVTRSQIVSVKYLTGLIFQVTMIAISTLAQAVRMSITGTFSGNDLLVMVLMLMIITFLSPAICLPLIFKLGVEKGRIAYYLMIGLVCGGGVAASRFMISDMTAQITFSAGMLVTTAAVIILYALSWYASIRFFAKREL